jgi:ABC-type multidrug transport system fused ATPase/permease subunit
MPSAESVAAFSNPLRIRPAVLMSTSNSKVQDILALSPLRQKRSSKTDEQSGHEDTHTLFFPAFAAGAMVTGLKFTFCEGNSETSNVPSSKPVAPRSASFQDLLSILGFWDWILLIAAILLTLLHTAFNLAIPSTFSSVMNACREKLDLAGPIRGFVFLQGIVIVLDGGRHFILSVLGERIRQKLRVQLYASLLKQEVTYFDFNARGELLSLLGEDVHRIQQCLTDQILGFLTAVATLIYGGYKVVTISPKATVLVLLSFPILSVANLLAQGSCRKKAMEVVSASRSNVSMATEVLNNPRTVQSFGAEEREAARYAESLQKQYSLECDYRAYTGLAHLAFSGINTLLSAAGLWYGALPTRRHRVPPCAMALRLPASCRSP